jgi:hypothetical protein
MASIEKALMTEGAKALLAGTKFVFSSYGNDIQFDSSGKLIMFEGKEKLVQSTLKILLTGLGEAAEDADYGSLLIEFVGGKLTNDSFTELVDTVQKAVIHYNDLNSDNDNSSEYVDTIDTIDVSRGEADPRVLVLKLTMTNEAGEKVNMTLPLVE